MPGKGRPFAKGHKGGPGRPKGQTNALPHGAVSAIKAAQQATENDPTADEALGVVLQVMRSPTRHAMARLSAARELLDRRRGRPRQEVVIVEPDPDRPRQVLLPGGLALPAAAAGLPTRSDPDNGS